MKKIEQANCIVIGGAGFIGTHLLSRLRGLSAGRIISLDIKHPRFPVSGVEYYIVDVVNDRIPDFDVRSPILFNLAAVHTTPGHEPWEYYATNVLGALNVCEFARIVGARQIVFTSSISVYGPDEAPKDESTEPAPVSDYGRSKYMSEKIHDLWLDEDSENRLVIVRPAVVFGQGEGGNFTRLARLLRKGVFFFPGRKDTVKSCIYVETLIDWMLLALSQCNSRILFNGSYAGRYTVEQIVNSFREVAFPKARVFLVPAFVLKIAAMLLRPVSSATGLGIHPDRITKLMVSTNVLPGWAASQGLTADEDLFSALRDWGLRTGGKFD